MSKSEPANTQSASANTELANTEFSTANSDLNIGNDNNGPEPEPEGNKHKYTKVFIKDPYNNRDTIQRLAKKQKGVYVWSSSDGKNMYVGRSINLYSRISSYFMPSILKSEARKVIKYLNKHSFNDINLTIYLMDIKSKFEDVVALEQHFIDSLKPNLNVALTAYDNAGSQDYNYAELWAKLRKLRGTPIYIYEAETLCLLYMFESKTHMKNTIGIDGRTLEDCLNSGRLYLDYFFLSLEPIETASVKLITFDEIKALVISRWDAYKSRYHPDARAVQAIFKDDARKNFKCDSLGSLARRLKGDRATIRGYLKGEKSGYYRGKWQFTYL